VSQKPHQLVDSTLVAQVAVVVRDIEPVRQAFAAALGLPVPEVVVTAGFDQSQTYHRGKPSEATAKLAFFPMGNLDIELIEPDHHPSTWREFLDEKGEGIHHLAFHVKGMKERTAQIEAAGMPLIMKGEYVGGRFAYFESTPQLKFILELLENDR